MDVTDILIMIPIIIGIVTFLSQRTENINQKIENLRKELQESYKTNLDVLNKHEARLAQIEAYINVLIKSSANIVKQPIHFIMDELIDKLMAGNATRDELVKLQKILNERYEIAVKARDPNAVFLAIMLLKIQLELSKYDGLLSAPQLIHK
jgi:hypothetical protein